MTAATSGEQERAAYGILSTPDTLLAIAATAVVGNGFTAIEQAASDPTLGPHYAELEVKRALRTGATADEPCRRALERLAGADVVVSAAERRRAVEALDRLEAPDTVHGEAIRREQVAGVDDAPDVGSLRELVAAARQRRNEAIRPWCTAPDRTESPRDGRREGQPVVCRVVDARRPPPPAACGAGSVRWSVR